MAGHPVALVAFVRGAVCGLLAVPEARVTELRARGWIVLGEDTDVLSEPRRPAMNMALLSNPRRYPEADSNSVEDRACD